MARQSESFAHLSCRGNSGLHKALRRRSYFYDLFLHERLLLTHINCFSNIEIK
jgi:hypothetical protein